MLKLGTQDISALYLGETKIKRAYLGETLVFEGSKPSRLPEGYTEVEYVQTDGNILINTNIKPSATLRMEMDMEQTEYHQYLAKLFHSVSSKKVNNGYTQYQALTLTTINNSGGISGQMMVYLSGNGYYTSISNDVPLKRMTIGFDYNDGSIFVGDVTKKFGKPSAYPTNYIFILGDSVTSYTKAKLYSCKFKTGGNLIRDYVPCVNPSGVVGLYDLINNGFIRSASTTPLTAGPPV